MKQEILQEIKSAAKQDFSSIQRCINKKQDKVTASIQNIRYLAKDGVVTATCEFDFDGAADIVEASIKYESTKDGIYSDSTISEVAKSVLGAVSLTPITAADDEDEFPEDDEFQFDDLDETMEAEPTEEEIDTEEKIEDEDERFEDPEEAPNIETDNNIENHYIVECDRCQGIFISALTESDQLVDHISGVCPLCEKESEQAVKWIIKPVEF